MTWKTAIVDIPFGGAKGVSTAPGGPHVHELEDVTRALVDKMAGVSAEPRHPRPDVNTNAQVMAWIMDEYGKLHGDAPAVVTGKPDRSAARLGASPRPVAAWCTPAARRLAHSA